MRELLAPSSGPRDAHRGRALPPLRSPRRPPPLAGVTTKRPKVADDTLALVLAVASASTPAELEAARLAAIESGRLLGPVACDGRHSTFLGCPTAPDLLGRHRFHAHPPLTLAAALGALARSRSTSR